MPLWLSVPRFNEAQRTRRYCQINRYRHKVFGSVSMHSDKKRNSHDLWRQMSFVVRASAALLVALCRE